jgi:hypothetical protein
MNIITQTLPDLRLDRIVMGIDPGVTFKFGVAYGALRATLVACNVPTHLISPSKWKRAYGLDSDKEKSRAFAIRLWPGCALFARKRDYGRAEAALLAKYGSTIQTNTGPAAHDPKPFPGNSRQWRMCRT